MGKVYVRVDDRLIHGQIVTAWSQTLGIKEIIAIDKDLVNNSMLQMITLMAVPKDLNPKIVSGEQAAEMLKEDVPYNRLVITRFCRNLNDIADAVHRAENINIGNCSKQEGAPYALNAPGGCTLSLLQEDYDTMENFAKAGVEIFSCRMPTEKAKTWAEMTKGR